MSIFFDNNHLNKRWIKRIISSLIPYYIQKKIRYYFRWKVPVDEKNNQLIEDKVKSHRPIKVLFIASTVPMWRAQGVFESLLKDNRFEAKIIISPYARYSSYEARLHVASMKDYFKSKGYDIPSTIDNDFNLDKWFEDFPPDIIFFSQHYEGIHQNRLDLERNDDVLRCFIPYGLPTMKEDFVYNLPTQNRAWRVYHATDLHLKTAKHMMVNDAKNVRIVGESDADLFFNGEKNDPWKIIGDGKIRKRIIWAPHFSMGNSCLLHRASFEWLYEGMIELAKKYADEVQFAFKPHPHLHSVLSDNLGWGRAKTDAYFQSWATMPNTQLEEGKFQDLFKWSDGMIHDCGSFTGEYMFVKKPVIFMSKDINGIVRKADDFGKKCLNLHYVGKSLEDADNFIKNVILTGDDPMKEERQRFYDEYLLPPNGKTVAENIHDDLVTSLGLI